MINSLYALILTDSLHLPTTIGYFNTRPAACQARQSAHAWLKGESQSVESLKCFSAAAMNILTQCSTMREAKAETKPLTLQSATTLAAPPIAPTIPITKTNTVSCSATKTCAAYKPVPQSPAKP